MVERGIYAHYDRQRTKARRSVYGAWRYLMIDGYVIYYVVDHPFYASPSECAWCPLFITMPYSEAE